MFERGIELIRPCQKLRKVFDYLIIELLTGLNIHFLILGVNSYNEKEIIVNVPTKCYFK